MSLPQRGPWVLTATSSSVDWTVAAAVLAAASAQPVALVLVAGGEPTPLLRSHVATVVELRTREAGTLRLDEVTGIARSLAKTHFRVLVAAADGVISPLGAGGWTGADLATALRAPVVVVTGTGADAVGHVRLSLEALEARRIPAAVIAIGAGGDFSALPVRLAGRIPADAAVRGADLAAAAADWLDPLIAPRTTNAAPAAGEPPGAAEEVSAPVEEAPGGAEEVSAPVEEAPGAAEKAPGATDHAADPVDEQPGATDHAADPVDGQPGATDHAADPVDEQPDATDHAADPVDGQPDATDHAADDRPGTTAGADDQSGADREDTRPVVTLAVPRDRQSVIARRAAWALATAFVVALLVLFICNGAAGPLTAGWTEKRVQVEVHPGHAVAPTAIVVPQTVIPPRSPKARRSASLACPTGRPTPSVDVADPTVAGRADAAWDRIERWLAAKAPASRAALRPPATPERIASVQVQMSVAFPPDLVASLRRHDGAQDRAAFELPPFYRPIGLDEMVRTWTMLCQILAESPDLNGDWWHKSYVPFAGAGDGGYLVVDQRPGSHGRVGEYYPDDGTHFERWPVSVAQLLEDVAHALEAGTPYVGFRPVVNADGELDWKSA